MAKSGSRSCGHALLRRADASAAPARVADYQGGVGTVWAYNAGVDWAPVRDLRFRANYSRAVRAPNVSETGFPLVPNFAPGFPDPCSSGNIGNDPTVRPTARPTSGRAARWSAEHRLLAADRQRSEPDLQAETSDSWTFGVVIQPRLIPGLSVSVDYYDITVDDIIVSLTAQTIVNSCYDSAGPEQRVLQPVRRVRRGPGPGSAGRASPGQILGNSLIQAPLNFAKREREGIDVNVAYRTQPGAIRALNTNLIYTHNLKISNFQNPALPDFENRVLGELGDPKDEFRWDVDLTYDPFTFGYRMRYIGPMWTGAYEDFNELDTACTAAGCPPNNADFADIRSIRRCSTTTSVLSGTSSAAPAPASVTVSTSTAEWITC